MGRFLNLELGVCMCEAGNVYIRAGLFIFDKIGIYAGIKLQNFR